MKKILFTTAMFVLSFQTIVFCQTENTVLKNAVSKIKALTVDHITEKAYLQFDRPYPYYVAGDIVYFKAYVTMGERHEPSTISGILHVDLINKNDILMQSIALKLSNGTGWGDFLLPDTLQKGSYRIRAYTEWMRNDKTPYFFDQYISVSSVSSVDRIAEAVNQARLQMARILANAARRSIRRQRGGSGRASALAVLGRRRARCRPLHRRHAPVNKTIRQRAIAVVLRALPQQQPASGAQQRHDQDKSDTARH